MSLITVDEFKASREAREAGVDARPNEDVQAALNDVEDELYSTIGYHIDAADVTSVTLYGSGGRRVVLPERVRDLSAVTEDQAAVGATDRRVVAGGFVLRRLGYLWGAGTQLVLTGDFGYEADDRVWRMGARAIRRAAARELATTTSEAPGAPYGSYLTGISSEGTSFAYFTPGTDPEVDRIVKQLMHPLLGDDKLRSLQISSGAPL